MDNRSGKMFFSSSKPELISANSEIPRVVVQSVFFIRLNRIVPTLYNVTRYIHGDFSVIGRQWPARYVAGILLWAWRGKG